MRKILRAEVVLERTSIQQYFGLTVQLSPFRNVTIISLNQSIGISVTYQIVWEFRGMKKQTIFQIGAFLPLVW